MEKKDENLLSPLTDVKLSEAEKDEMWATIEEAARRTWEAPSGSKASFNHRSHHGYYHRWAPVKVLWAGALGIVMAVAVSYGVVRDVLPGSSSMDMEKALPTSAASHQERGSTASTQPQSTQPQVTQSQPTQSQGGHNTSVTGPTRSLAFVSKIQMFNSVEGWAEQTSSNELTLLRTTDGGHIWKDVTPEIGKVGSVNVSSLDPTKQYEFASGFPDANSAVLMWTIPQGTSGKAAYTEDIFVESTANGGRSWVTSEVPNTGMPYGQSPLYLHFVSDKVGYLTTMPSDGGGMINFFRQGLYKTIDGGITWHQISRTANSSNSLPSTNASSEEGWVSFLNSTLGFTLGEAPTRTDYLDSGKPILYRTVNGGGSWNKVTVALPSASGVGSVQVTPPQEQGGTVFLPVLVKDVNPNRDSLYLYVSSNDGKVFHQMGTKLPLPEVPVSQFPVQFGFWNTSDGWVWLDGILLKTTNGGLTFQRISWSKDKGPASTAGVPQISWINRDVAYATDENSLWKTVDGGKAWTKVPSVIEK